MLRVWNHPMRMHRPWMLLPARLLLHLHYPVCLQQRCYAHVNRNTKSMPYLTGGTVAVKDLTTSEQPEHSTEDVVVFVAKNLVLVAAPERGPKTGWRVVHCAGD